MSGEFHRYLRAKRTVDDRSLDRRLLDRLHEGVAERASEGPLRVLDVGAGLGTMLERFLEWDVLPAGTVEYTAVDVESANARAIPDHLSAWAADREIAASASGSRVDLSGPDREVAVEAVAAEAASYAERADREWDLLVGAALLDVAPLDRLPALLSALAPGGWWYFPITFDGGTRFLPDHPADDAVERYYHRHMDEKPGGDSHAADHALERLLSMESTTVEAAAGSDWVVAPADGGYPADEADFLLHILGTVEGALGEMDRGADLDSEALEDWLTTRRGQVDAGELTYLTHQLDLLGRSTS
jgi:hypothetical protein